MRWMLGAIWGGEGGRGVVVVVVAVGRMGARYDDGGTSGEGVVSEGEKQRGKETTIIDLDSSVGYRWSVCAVRRVGFLTPLERMMDGDVASFLGAWILAREGEAYAARPLCLEHPAHKPSRTRTKRNKSRERRRRRRRLNGKIE